ncbi:MAG: hypothetical protein FJZ09_02950 [Candidatus Omnitrophica bacterium]|nr:hypothetical protein [Candidatus Omnitrophota bacterium]
MMSLRDVLVSLCEKVYCPEGARLNTSIFKDSEKGLIDFSRKNRLEHYLALEYPDLNLKEPVSEYESYKDKLVNSLRWLKKLLGDEKFLIIKTFSAFPHLTSDLDVLLKDTKFISRARKEAAKLKKEEFLAIDISTEVSWGGAHAVSNDFIWKNTRDFRFEGISLLIPDSVLDTLIRLAHIPFELAEIRLGELLHMYKQISLFDHALLREEAERMGWPRTFERVWRIFEALHRSLYKMPLAAGSKPDKVIAVPDFPFALPYFLLAQAVVEKRAWGKLAGARFIIKDRIIEWRQKNFR